MEDLDSIMDDISPVTPKENNSNYNRKPYNDNKKKDEWKAVCDEDMYPKRIEDISDNFKRDKKYFVFEHHGELTDEEINKVVKVATYLMQKGFIFRHSGDSNNKVQNAILAANENIVVHSYLPWKKFNTNIENPYFFKVDKNGCSVAAAYRNNFNDLKRPYKTILARNIHLMLGKELDRPATLLLTYTKDGLETTGRDMDFNLVGNVVFFLKIAKESNIPVFNLFNSDATTRLKELVNSVSPVADI